MQVTKSSLRTHFKQIRLNMNSDEKAKKHLCITENCLKLDEYINAKGVLVYISSKIEVDTLKIIENCFQMGKKVYAPRCSSFSNEMKFYEINTFDDLEKGRFDILEPKKSCRKMTENDYTICIVPALAYNLNGYRLGFGKGFYDRYLNSYCGVKIGICYDNCIGNFNFNDEFDIPVNILVTESKTFKVENEERIV